MHIGVIPARKGSKRFPGKNKALLNGVPLYRRAYVLAYPIMTTLVNTDDEEILKEKSIVTYKRSAKLSQDNIKVDDVLLDMVGHLSPEIVIHLFQPTSPFISRETIFKGMELIENSDSVQSVCLVNNTQHAYSQRQIVDGNVNFVFHKLRKKSYNSQLKPKFYQFAGYAACKVGSLKKYGNIWGKVSLPIVVDWKEAIDIDTKEDLEYAQLLINAGIII